MLLIRLLLRLGLVLLLSSHIFAITIAELRDPTLSMLDLSALPLPPAPVFSDSPREQKPAEQPKAVQVVAPNLQKTAPAPNVTRGANPITPSTPKTASPASTVVLPTGPTPPTLRSTTDDKRSSGTGIASTPATNEPPSAPSNSPSSRSSGSSSTIPSSSSVTKADKVASDKTAAVPVKRKDITESPVIAANAPMGESSAKAGTSDSAGGSRDSTKETSTDTPLFNSSNTNTSSQSLTTSTTISTIPTLPADRPKETPNVVSSRQPGSPNYDPASQPPVIIGSVLGSLLAFTAIIALGFRVSRNRRAALSTIPSSSSRTGTNPSHDVIDIAPSPPFSYVGRRHTTMGSVSLAPIPEVSTVFEKNGDASKRDALVIEESSIPIVTPSTATLEGGVSTVASSARTSAHFYPVPMLQPAPSRALWQHHGTTPVTTKPVAGKHQSERSLHGLLHPPSVVDEKTVSF